MKKLKKIHENIKEHRYRLNNEERYRKAYGKLLYDLIKHFYEVAKNDLKGGFGFFIHEAYSVAWNLKESDSSYTKFYKDGKEMDKDIIIAAELIIGDIHRYIKTGKIDKLHLYYTGCNTGGKDRKSTLLIEKGKLVQKRPRL